jgi:hypothetical protein
VATRFYLPSSGTAPVTPPTPTGWDGTSGYVVRPCATTKSNTALTTKSNSKTVSTSGTNYLNVVFISPQIGAGVISGTFSAVLRGAEDSITRSMFHDLIIKVVSADGQTVRGTLYAGSTAGTSSGTVGAENEEYATSLTTRIKNGIAVTSVTAQTGDRIQIEIGTKSGYNIASGTASINFGDPSATADFALTSGLTTALCPWVELSATLPPPSTNYTSNPADTADGTDAVALARTPAALPDVAAGVDATSIGTGRNPADVAAGVDATTKAVGPGVADVAAATDAASFVATVNTTISDVAAGVDVATPGVGYNRTASDVAAIADAVTTSLSVNTTASDTADGVDAVVIFTGLVGTGADFADAIDAITTLATNARIISDLAGAIDIAGVGQTRTAADVAAGTDASTAGRGSSPSDTAGVVDAVSVVITANVAIGDVAAAVDAAALAVSRTASDVADVIDATSFANGFFQAPSDVAATVDAASRVAAVSYTASDTAAGVDAISPLQAIARASADAAALVDASSLIRDLFLNPNDVGAATDVISPDLAVNPATPVAPILVATYGSSTYTATSGGSGTRTTTGITVEVGDVLVLVGGTQDVAVTLATPTGGTGFTWTLQQSVLATSYCATYIWTAVATVAQTFTLSQVCTSVNTGIFYNLLYRFASAGGVGTAVAAHASTGTPSLNITTTTQDSAIVIINNDWVPVDGATRAFTEEFYYYGSTTATFYSGYYPDVNAPGVKTVGMTAPAGQGWALIGIEVKGYTTYDTAKHDSGGAVDAVSRSVLFDRLLEQGMADILDDVSFIQAITQSLSDVAAVTDIASVDRPKDFTDTAAATDASTTARGDTENDTADVVDDIVIFYTDQPYLQDVAAIVDAVTISVSRAIADTADALDTATASRSKIAADAAAVTDAVTAFVSTYIANPLDTVHATDAVSFTRTTARTASDIAAIIDAVISAAGRFRTAADVAAAVDAALSDRVHGLDALAEIDVTITGTFTAAHDRDTLADVEIDGIETDIHQVQPLSASAQITITMSDSDLTFGDETFYVDVDATSPLTAVRALSGTASVEVTLPSDLRNAVETVLAEIDLSSSNLTHVHALSGTASVDVTGDSTILRVVRLLSTRIQEEPMGLMDVPSVPTYARTFTVMR